VVKKNKNMRKITTHQEVAARLFMVLPFEVTKHYSTKADGIMYPSEVLEDFVLSNREWAEEFINGSYSHNDIIHDFVGIISKEEFFIPRLGNTKNIV
jgi:hypothetical protein